MPRLDFYQETEIFVQVKLENKPLRLGRSETCDITLNDPRISRIHAEIRRDGDRFLLVDKSKNGTRLNSSLVSDAADLEYGDRIYINDYTIIFNDDTQPADPHIERSTIVMDE